MYLLSSFWGSFLGIKADFEAEYLAISRKSRHLAKAKAIPSSKMKEKKRILCILELQSVALNIGDIQVNRP